MLCRLCWLWSRLVAGRRSVSVVCVCVWLVVSVVENIGWLVGGVRVEFCVCVCVCMISVRIQLQLPHPNVSVHVQVALIVLCECVCVSVRSSVVFVYVHLSVNCP